MRKSQNQNTSWRVHMILFFKHFRNNVINQATTFILFYFIIIIIIVIVIIWMLLWHKCNSPLE